MSYAVVAAGDGDCECDGRDFEHHLTIPGVHLFTAGWCPHCKKMDEDMNDENHVSPYPYHKHDDAIMSEEDKKRRKDIFTVEGFPTIYFVERVNGELVKREHKGERTKRAIDAAYASFLEEVKNE